MRCLRDGGLVAYPTETVWGLGADATSDEAVDALRRFKGRGDDAPISILVEGVEVLGLLDFELDSCAERLAKQFWPTSLERVVG